MTTNNLTERYVHEVVRRIPADQRTDVANELRATIADTIDAREPDDRQAAEREVLNDMGDPIRLAASYADRPQALIGAELYPAYVRLVTMLLTIVLPIVVAVVMAMEAIDTANVGKTIGAGFSAVVPVGGQLIAWPTVIFALIERVGGRREVATVTSAWSVDKLPDRGPETKRDLGDTVPSIVWHLLLLAGFIWNYSYLNDAGDRVHVLDQSLWTVWLWPILAGLAGIVIIEIVRIAKGRWTMAMAGWHALVHVLFTVPLIWVLAKREFFSAQFLTDTQSTGTIEYFYSAVGIGVLMVNAWAVIKRFRQAKAAR